MKHWVRFILGMVASLLILCPFFYSLGQMSVDIPEPVIEYVEVEKIIERVVIEERLVKEIVTVVKEVDKVKWRNIYARQFESVEHFKEWYLAQDFKPLGPSSVFKVDCDDYAERLQRTALRQGYSVSVALVKDGRYYNKKVTDVPDGHAGNLVLIDGVYFYLEPSRDIKLIKVVNRD